MKKVFLTLALFAGFAVTINAEEIIVSDCGEDSSPISSSCWSGCVSITPALTGNLEFDMGNVGPRKPTKAEFQVAQAMLDDYCSS